MGDLAVSEIKGYLWNRRRRKPLDAFSHFLRSKKEGEKRFRSDSGLL